MAGIYRTLGISICARGVAGNTMLGTILGIGALLILKGYRAYIIEDLLSINKNYSLTYNGCSHD